MGTILSVGYFNLKPGKREEFAKWLKDYEETFRRFVASQGGNLRGIYLGTFGLAPADGMTMMEFSSYEDFDVIREADDPEFAKAMTAFESLTERPAVSSQLWELVPDALTPVVVRKHKGKRAGK
jgi:hypothetical protein